MQAHSRNNQKCTEVAGCEMDKSFLILFAMRCFLWKAVCSETGPYRLGKLRHEVASVAVGTESSGPNPMFCHRYPTKTCAWSNLGVGSSWDNEASPDKGGDSTVRDGRDC